MDVRLQSLVDAAERHQPVPDVCLLVDSWLVQRTPVSFRHFLGLTRSNLNTQARSTLTFREQKTVRSTLTEDQFWRVLSAQTSPLLATIDPPVRGPDGGIHLSPVVLEGSVGKIETAGIRIPLDAIRGWWVGSFRHTPRRAAGGGVSVEF